MKDNGIVFSSYAIYFNGKDTMAVTSDNANRILSALKEKDMTISELSRALDIPVSTVNNTMKTLIDCELATQCENQSARKQHYHKSCINMAYKDGNTDIDKDIIAETEKILTLYASNRGTISFYSCLYGWLMHYGRNLGMNFMNITKRFGRAMYQRYRDSIHAETIEQAVDNVRQVMGISTLFQDFTVVSWMPLTVRFKSQKDYPDIPTEEFGYMFAEFVAAMMEDHIHKSVRLDRLEIIPESETTVTVVHRFVV